MKPGSRRAFRAHMRSVIAGWILPGLAAGCVPPPAAAPVTTTADVTVYEEAPPPTQPERGPVLVLVDKRVGRPSEVLAILDFHSNAADEQKGFEELRARAFAIGADAVIGAEFEHGSDGGASHLSGIAVRFLDH